MDLTIAVCTYRRFADLRLCLENIQRQTMARSRFKVLVIDNSLQPDMSAEFRDSLNLDYEIDYVITPKNGIAYARNQAIHHCKTQYLGYVDDDVTIAPNWAEVLLDTFARHNGRAGCVSGKILPKYETPPPAWLKDNLLWPLAILDWGDEEKPLPESEWFVTASIGFDMRALKLSGGFAENLGRKGDIPLAHEDLQIVTSLRRMGYGLVYNPDFQAKHFIPTTRMTQDWYCRDAFWQAVSRAVFVSNSALQMDDSLINELKVAADRLEKDWEFDPDAQSVTTKLRSVSQDASIIMSRYGCDATLRDPKPEFRTFYIVTPTHNSISTIEDTFRSIFSQAGNHFVRYHVQDGVSTDGTIDVVKEWQRKINENNLPFPVKCRGIHMTWDSAPDEGMYSAISKGFSLLPIMPADIMTWINSDDVFADDVLSVMDRVFTFQNEQWALGSTAHIDETGIPLPEHYNFAYPVSVIKNGLCDSSFWKTIQQEGLFWRKSLWDKTGGVNRNFKLAGDWDLWRRFAHHAEPVHIEQPTGYFRRREGQLSADFSQYKQEMDATISEPSRAQAANEIARKVSENNTYRRFELETGAIVSAKLRFANLPTQIIESEDEFARSIINHIASYTPAKDTEITAASGAEVDGHITPDEKPADDDARSWLGKLYSKTFARLIRYYRFDREYKLLRRSNLFLAEFYRQKNSDVKQANIDPLTHYIKFGAREGRSPNPLFHESYYKYRYSDVAGASVAGLTHYVRSGWKELRDPHPDFSTETYLELNPDVKEAGVNPLRHYLLHGLSENRLLQRPHLEEGKAIPAHISSQQTTKKPTLSKHLDDRIPPAIEVTSIDQAKKWMIGKDYSKTSHWSGFDDAAERYLDSIPGPDEVDLKVYQDLFMASFIERFVPKGSRVLEIGGGDSRILRHFGNDFECWNIDKLEGHGNGPTDIGTGSFRLVRDYMGSFSEELPDKYFDFVFSISVLEHIKSTDKNQGQIILDDIRRVSASNCQNLHLVDVVCKSKSHIWSCDLIQDWLPKVTGKHWKALEEQMTRDEDLFVMSKSYYERTWRHTTGKSYEQFGRPASLNVYWV